MGRISDRFTQQQLSEIIEYNPETGIAYWKEKIPVKTKEDVRFNTLFAGKPVGHVSRGGYIFTKINSLFYAVHRLVFYLYHGVEPDVIDHLNGDPADNRILNIRACTTSENQRNITPRKTNVSRVNGVSYSPKYNRWIAQISINKHKTYLGSFQTMEEAINARLEAEKGHGFIQRGFKNLKT